MVTDLSHLGQLGLQLKHRSCDLLHPADRARRNRPALATLIALPDRVTASAIASTLIIRRGGGTRIGESFKTFDYEGVGGCWPGSDGPAHQGWLG